MKQLLLAILLAFPAIAFSDKKGDSCQYVDLHVQLNQIHGVLHSKVTLLLTVSLSSFQCVDWFSMV